MVSVCLLFKNGQLIPKGDDVPMKEINNSWIKLGEYINVEDYRLINGLQNQCTQKEQITLKLELDYKLGVSSNLTGKGNSHRVNEFMYFDGDELIGYIGICDFGGPGSTIEVTGMVAPEYRRQGVFMKLHDLVTAECRHRSAQNILVLCDSGSVSGQAFIQVIGAVYKYSEIEMYLQNGFQEISGKQRCGITLRKATNADYGEICMQDAIYFGDEDTSAESAAMPEDEEKRGMTIYLAEKDKQVIGKVNLQTSAKVGGIYGLGVLPEYRGKGFGKAILLEAVEKLKEAKSQKIMLQVATENLTALGLYRSCGFHETSVMDYFELNC